LFAHRVTWEIVNGPIPDGLLVLHHCDNPPCTNPIHLFLGTIKDNSHDAMHKGRLPHGERVSGSKLTPEIIRLIRDSTDGQYDLAERFGVNQSHISRIRSRQVWRHIK